MSGRFRQSLSKQLKRWNIEIGHTPLRLPFSPTYVVIAIQNVAEHKGESTFAASYKVAYIVPSEMVFSDDYDFEKVSQAAYVDRAPFYFDAPSAEEAKHGWSPAERYKWLAIERHEAFLKSNAKKTVKKRTGEKRTCLGSGRSLTLHKIFVLPLPFSLPSSSSVLCAKPASPIC